MFKRLQYLKEHYNFYPKIIYDIGAYEGVWTSECKKIFPISTYYQFEANDDKLPFLKDNPTIALLADKDNLELNYYKTSFEVPTGNSIFKENTLFFDDSRTTIVKKLSKTLDTLVEEKSFPYPDFIKLDTQGSELLILSGANKSLEHCQVVLMEVSLHQYNKGSPLIHNVLEFMAKHNFVMFDIVDLSYLSFGKHKGILNQIDVLFCKKDSPYFISKFY